MAELAVASVVKRYGDAEVLHGIDLDVRDGEFCVLVGPSGCGKSTLLRVIAGLEDASEGSVAIGGEDVTDLEPAARKIAMVFQSYALYPHMNVYDNMAFGLKHARYPKAEIDTRVRRAAKTLQIEPLLARRPRELSGGQRQRVAIGRAIVREPRLFLFDEPLSNLDAALRVEMRVELAKLKATLGTTIVYVTHDQVEAMTLADRIVVLRDGRIEQSGAPLVLYRAPANRFVAGFIGSPKMNFVPVRVVAADAASASVELPGGATLAMPLDAPAHVGDLLTLGIRPEHIALGARGDATLKGEIAVAEHLGGESYLHVRRGDEMIVIKTDGSVNVPAGGAIEWSLRAADAHLFRGDGQRISRAGAPPHVH